MIADEKHQQDYQVEGAIVLGEDFQPRPIVSVYVSEDSLATHINQDNKHLYWVPVCVQYRTEWSLIDNDASPNLITQRN